MATDSEAIRSALKNNPPLNEVQINYMKMIEKENLERVKKLKNLRMKNVRTGLGLGSLVVGIFCYSMYAVRQEKFLDDLEDLAKIKEL